VQCELLWSRLSDDLLPTAWSALRSLATPEETIAAMPVLRRLAARWGREDRCAPLEETARWFVDHVVSLGPESRAGALTEAPNVTTAIADLAVRVVPGPDDDPVLITYGVLRVAARFHGEPVDKQNRLSDGRLAVARMVGAEDCSHSAHLALMELANGLCSPQKPACGLCPLQSWCVEAGRSAVQTALPLTTRGKRRGRATARAGA
jgi:DNA (cytosine-5)-methyltransferase 1